MTQAVNKDFVKELIVPKLQVGSLISDAQARQGNSMIKTLDKPIVEAAQAEFVSRKLRGPCWMLFRDSFDNRTCSIACSGWHFCTQIE